MGKPPRARFFAAFGSASSRIERWQKCDGAVGAVAPWRLLTAGNINILCWLIMPEEGAPLSFAGQSVSASFNSLVPVKCCTLIH